MDNPSLARQLGVPRVYSHEEIGSTMDEAHRLAQTGTVPGTLVLADRQTAGRGRQGRAWASAPGAGVWLTVIERPRDPSVIDILSLRLGLHVARALDRFVSTPVRVKSPNDLYILLGDGAVGKVGGILCEARWRGAELGWVAIGLGVNVLQPEGVEGAAALPGAPARLDVLMAVVPALRAGARVEGGLTEEESSELKARAVVLVGAGFSPSVSGGGSA